MSTGIEWTDETWNCVKGCSRVSEGCRNCYAERLAARFSGPGQPYEGLARFTPSGPRWTGKVVLDERALEKPLHWKKPRRVFVNSMSDLFHEGLSFSSIHRVWGIMKACPQHQFQILTKRPQWMCDDVMRIYRMERLGHAMGFWSHVWLGVSVEDQVTADERIPLLLQTPAAVRFVSCEPLLGPITLQTDMDTPMEREIEYLTGYGTLDETQPQGVLRHAPLDWVIVGEESGPGVRVPNIQWVKDIVVQCEEHRVPVFVKQLCFNGRKLPFDQWWKDLQVRQWPEVKT